MVQMSEFPPAPWYASIEHKKRERLSTHQGRDKQQQVAKACLSKTSQQQLLLNPTSPKCSCRAIGQENPEGVSKPPFTNLFVTWVG